MSGEENELDEARTDCDDLYLAQCQRVASAESDLERMRDGISDMKAALQSEIDAERLRGDTYRRRALALMKQAKAWRILTNIESTTTRRDVSRLKCQIVNEINYLKEWRQIK